MEQEKTGTSINILWKTQLTCDIVETCFVEQPREQLEANDCVNDYDK